MTACFTLELFPFVSLQMSPLMREVSRPQTKEEEDIDILCSWVQVGGFLLTQRRRHRAFC